jgi:hypothetical protein
MSYAQGKRQVALALLAAALVLTCALNIAPFPVRAAEAKPQFSLNGTLEYHDNEDGSDYILVLDSLDGIPSLYASGAANNTVELYGYKIDFAAYVGKRVMVSSTVERAFNPTRNGLGFEITSISDYNGGAGSNQSAQTTSGNADIEEANRVLSALSSRHDLTDWLTSDRSMIERAMIHWCGGESVPASVIEDNLRRYFGVESVDHNALAINDGVFIYANGYYTVAASGWAEYDWANVTKYSDNGDGSITAQVTLYSAPIEEYDANGRYLGEPVPDFYSWYFKDTSEWQVPCEQYKYGLAEVVMKPYKDVNSGVQTWQIVSIDGIDAPRILPAGVSAEISPVGNEFTFTVTGSRYQLYDGRGISWNEAKVFCEKSGGHLAVFTTSEENDFVFAHSIINDVQSAYFGFSDYEEEGDWKWVTNEPVGYVNWHDGEPNNENGSEDYAMFYWKFDKGTWNDGDFGGSTVGGGNVFICEWDGQPTDDSDKDGLPDDWELNGVTIDGVHLPLNEWGADPNKKDVFVEIDWVEGYKPSAESLRMVYQVFQNHGINLHIDCGADSVDFVTSKTWGEQSGGAGYLTTDILRIADTANWYSLWFGKTEHLMSAARWKVFRHFNFVDGYEYNNESRTGVSVTDGQFGVVSVGYLQSNLESLLEKVKKANTDWKKAKEIIFGYTTTEELTKAVAGTFMHELGHTLGLLHGGNKDEERRANYYSVMSYAYQITGVPPKWDLEFSDTANPFNDWSYLINRDWRTFQYSSIGFGTGLSQTDVGLDALPKEVGYDDLLFSLNALAVSVSDNDLLEITQNDESADKFSPILLAIGGVVVFGVSVGIVVAFVIIRRRRR